MRFEFEIDGRRLIAESEWIRGQLWIYLDGKTFIHASETELKSRASKKSGAPGLARDLMAPMPGKVTKIIGKPGDPVKKGTAVVVLEAMKMEYTLKSEGEGHIEALHCQVGEQVVLGKLLVKIKPKS